MSWWHRATTPRDTLALERIADALDRIAPIPETPTDAEPSAVDYVSEDRMAAYEEAERLGALEQYTRHLEEQAATEADAAAQEELDVQPDGHSESA